MGGEQREDRIAPGANLDFMVLEGAALSHDTGMNGHGYALTIGKDEEGNSYNEMDTDGDYSVHKQDNNNFPEIRSNHSLVSAMNMLVNRKAYVAAGYFACRAEGTDK